MLLICERSECLDPTDFMKQKLIGGFIRGFSTAATDRIKEMEEKRENDRLRGRRRGEKRRKREQMV